MHGLSRSIAIGVASFVCLGLGFAFSQKTAKAKPVAKATYASIAGLMKNCSMCHSGPQPKHGLDLTSYAKVMKGDHEGKVVVAGKPGESRLSKAVHGAGAPLMPPMGKLPAADIAKIDAWIKAGAKP